MTQEFMQTRTENWGPEDASLWQVRVLLTIAQQLTVIAAHLKKIADRP
jgi:hypothetical protein